MKKIFWIFIIIGIICHLYALTFPLATLEDEGSYIGRGILVLEVIHSFPIWIVSTAVLLGLVLCFLAYKIYKKNENWGIAFLTFLSVIYYLIISYYGTNFQIAKFGTIDLYNIVWMVRYGSLSAAIYTIQLLIFGYREWAMRLVPLFFAVMTSVYMYKLVLLYKNENWALFSSIALFFMPGFFYYVNITQLTTGIAFFCISSIYYLIKYKETKKRENLVLMSLFLILGVQYKETVFLAYIVICLYLIFLYLKKRDLNFKLVGKYIILGLIPTIIWIYTEIKFGSSTSLANQRFTSLGLETMQQVLRYLFAIPSEATWPIFILFLLSLPFTIYYIIKKKDELSFIFLFYFLGIYSFITIDSFNNYSTVYRYGADLLPAIAYFSFFPINFIKIKNIKKIILYLLIIFLIITSTYLTYNNWENRYVPMDGTFLYIKNNIPESARILRPMAPNPYKFYIEKYKLKQYFKHEIWVPPEEQNISNLYEFMINENYTYFMFPRPSLSYHSYWPNNYSWTHTTRMQIEPVLNDKLLFELIKNKNNYFEMIYKEEIGPNGLYLLRIKNKS